MRLNPGYLIKSFLPYWMRYWGYFLDENKSRNPYLKNEKSSPEPDEHG
jgi:hypothetical protein